MILLLCFFSPYSSLWRSDTEIQHISFQYNNTPLRTVLERLSQEYHFNFIFDDALVGDIFVTFKVVNESPNAALSKLLQPYLYSCEFLTRNTIIIRRAAERIMPYRWLKGCVCDAETGLPLVSANACIQGKNICAATDINGNFTFKIPNSTLQLVVSYKRVLYNSSFTQQSPEMILAEEIIQETNLNQNQFCLNGISAHEVYHIPGQWKGECTVSHTEQRHYNKWAWSAAHDTRLPDVTDNTYYYLSSEGRAIDFRVKSWNEKFSLYYSASPAYAMKAGVHLEQLR